MRLDELEWFQGSVMDDMHANVQLPDSTWLHISQHRLGGDYHFWHNSHEWSRSVPDGFVAYGKIGQDTDPLVAQCRLYELLSNPPK